MVARKLPAWTLLIAATAAIVGASAIAEPIVPPASRVEGSERESAEARFRSHMSSATQALRRNDYASAVASFEAAGALYPTAPEPLEGLAEVARQRKDFGEAAKWLARAAQVAPQNAQVQRNWGRLHVQMRDYDAAEAAFKKSTELDPQSAQSYSDLADLYLSRLRRPAAAAAAYRQVIKLQPNNIRAQLGLGLALDAQGKQVLAIAQLEKAATLAPRDPATLEALGRVHFSVGNLTAALAAFDGALALRGDYVPAIAGRGSVFMARNDFRRAAVEFEKVAKAQPSNAVGRFQLGAAYEMLGRGHDAEREYRAAIDANGEFAPAYNNLAMLYVSRNGDLAAALDWAQRAVTVQPGMAPFQDTLGRVHLARGELEPAISAFRTAVKLSPGTAEFYVNLGDALARNGTKSEAISALNRALSVDPVYPRAAEVRRRIAELGGTPPP